MSTDLAPEAVMHGLTSHVVEALNPVLPADLSLVDLGLQIALLTGSSPPLTVATHHVDVPERMTDSDTERRAGYLLSDVQDMVAMHLHTPWPVTPSGRTMHADTALDDGRIRLTFATSDGTGRIELPDFVLPGPGRTVLAG